MAARRRGFRTATQNLLGVPLGDTGGSGALGRFTEGVHWHQEVRPKKVLPDNKGHFSNNAGDSNTCGSFNCTNNYSGQAFSSIPGTFNELLEKNLWGVPPPEIGPDYLQDPFNIPEDDTGEWIFKEEWYKEWQDGEGSKLLWLCGSPGTGKTMLAKRVVGKFLLGPHGPPSGVKLVYHFISPEPPTEKTSADDPESRKRRIAKVACDLLYVILQQDGSLFEHCKAELTIQGDKLFANPGSSWEVLRKTIQDCPTHPVYILVDGLDGSDAGLCQELIRRILKLGDIDGVKLFFSSRDVPYISNSLPEHRKINIDRNDSLKTDLETVITRKFDAFSGWDGEQRAGAIKALLEKSEGTFLWASLAAENLQHSSQGHNYKAFLRKLPLGLGNLYQKMLRDVQSLEGWEEVLKMIQTVALALRPLTFGELGHILARREEDEVKITQDSSPAVARPKVGPKKEKEVRKYVQCSWSFLLATTTHVSIVHHTAVEWLFYETLPGNPHTYSKSELDLTVSWECFRYLHDAIGHPEKPPAGSDRRRHAKHRQSYSEGGHPREPVEAPGGVGRQECVDEWPYLGYAAEYWFLHARRGIEIPDHKSWDDSTGNWLGYPFFGRSDSIRRPWIGLCGDPKMEVLAGEQTPLHVAVCLGLIPLVEKALSAFDPETDQTNDSLSPLHLAARPTSRAYKILIDKGSPSLLTQQGQYGNTPLHEAAISGHWSMLKALVETFAKSEDEAHSGQINKGNDFGDTPIHLAVQFDHPDLVEFLIQNGACLTIGNGLGVTASDLSVKLGRGEISDILKQAEGALVAASELERPEGSDIPKPTEKEIVVAPADETVMAPEIKLKNNDQSLLHLAARFTSRAYKILIDKGSPSLLTAQGQYGNTPLHEAAISGHWSMLKALVERFEKSGDRAYSGQINRANDFGDTPLHLAVRFEHPDIVEFLAKNGADTAIKNKLGVTASDLSEKLGRGESSDILNQEEKLRKRSRRILRSDV